MKAFVLERYGRQQALQMAEIAVPDLRKKSLLVLNRGGKLISISGPPDPEFGRDIKAPGFVRLAMRWPSSGIRRKPRSRGVSYSFLFTKANASQLREVTRLIDAGAIRPVVARVLAFESTNEAMAYVEAGRAKGKVVARPGTFRLLPPVSRLAALARDYAQMRPMSRRAVDAIFIARASPAS